MLALKAFVHESVTSLDDARLQLLSETLRIDLRGCDDRRDIERVVTGLLCLDQDTSLGVFLSWLRASEDHGVLSNKKKPFHNTFVPTIAPQDQQLKVKQSQHAAQSSNQPEDHVKDHHLDEEIQARLAELQVLETEFKAAERVAHTGTPTFEKLKAFLVHLTLLRAKEEETRRFFLKQNAILKREHGEMRAEALHTRAQLDFFVDGFTNLRLRHDALLEKSTQMHAESEMAQEIFLSMSAHESHFAAIMAHTLEDQRAKNVALKARFEAAQATISELQETQRQLKETISRLKQARGDAKKDAHCYKQQLRRRKLKMKDMEQASDDCDFFRQQTMNLRQSFANLLGYLRESVLRDTKTPKQALSKEALLIIHHALNGSAVTTALGATQVKPLTPATANEPPSPPARSSGLSMMDAIQENSAAPEAAEETHVVVALVPKVVKKTAEKQKDLDEAMRGILLIGGAEEESAKCALIMSSKLKYAPIDVNATLLLLEEQERERQQIADVLLAGASGDDIDQPPPRVPLVIPSTVPHRPLQITSYQTAFKKHIEDEMQHRGARGFILFNWEFSTHDANLLIGLGFPVDSIIDLQTPPPPAAATQNTPPPAAGTTKAATRGQKQPPGSPARSQAAATPTTSPVKASARTPSADSKKPTTTTTASSSKSPAKPAPVSPSRAGSRQLAPKTPETSKKRLVETPSKQSQQTPPSSSSSKRPAATPSSSQSQKSAASPDKKLPKIDHKVVFKGMLHLYQQVAPATFPEERVQLILDVLEQQKETKAAPFVQWDENTLRTNEMLSMFAEDVHMMLYVEQENRKPKKPGESTPLPSSRATSNSPVKPGGSTSKTGSLLRVAPAAGKTSRANSKSPVKPTATARGSGAAAAATSRRATSTAVSQSVSPVPPAAGAAPPESPDRKRASVATSSPSSKLAATTTWLKK